MRYLASGRRRRSYATGDVRAVMPMLLSVQTQHCNSTNSKLTQNDASLTNIPGI